MPSVTAKDYEDLDFGLEHDVEWVALSFVRTASEVLKVKEYIQNKGKSARLIAKIEKPEAISNIDEIIEASDAIMVARGDLGVEIGDAALVAVQKKLIARSRQLNKIVITATQMMESMISSPMPTRAEVMDVANAVLDGTDAVMLSAETAVGRYPLETVREMIATWPDKA